MEQKHQYIKIRKAIIPAAGLGTRFLPATKAVPKEMMPIVDRPAIQYTIEEALRSGIKEILIVTGRDKESIEDHFDRSFELEAELERKGRLQLLEEVQRISQMAEIHFIRQKEPLGLGHAVNKGRVFAAGEPVAVLLPDELMDCETPCIRQMMEVYEEHGCSVVGVREVPWEDVSRYGVVEGESQGTNRYRVRNLIEKPKMEEAPSNLAIVGRYIITPEIFDLLDDLQPQVIGELQLTDALCALAKKRPMLACTFSGNRYDCGDKMGFLQATVELGLKHPILGKEFHRYLKSVMSELQ